MRLFITGTDTGIGKTVSTCLLLRALNAKGIAALGMKPIAAGINAYGSWDDVELIRAASDIQVSLEDMAPYRLQVAASPHFAAEAEKVTIRQEIILRALTRLEQRAQIVVIEGVGGFRVPLSADFDSADLAQAIAAPLLLVVPMRLGCINHALLSAEAISNRGLALIGWIANAGSDPEYERVAATIETLSERMTAPCVGVLPQGAFEQGNADCLKIEQILASTARHSKPGESFE
ncbi:MAG: dethiobiotin synthase [Betaproteobacteria bacterium]|nr:dethiobiotin synthase [Betaproteobacteria bacterium]